MADAWAVPPASLTHINHTTHTYPHRIYMRVCYLRQPPASQLSFSLLYSFGDTLTVIQAAYITYRYVYMWCQNERPRWWWHQSEMGPIHATVSVTKLYVQRTNTYSLICHTTSPISHILTILATLSVLFARVPASLPCRITSMMRETTIIVLCLWYGYGISCRAN